ncbi:glycosyltransferase family 2 protein [Kozakia baliensis]|uniref:glycosyltransferase family 2 protein n=1 Tax=Kozakia baliensis TaxID=153496 RepID=UPI0004982221|nr:glycosyltransferase family A protein [Kozakia baliensis]
MRFSLVIATIDRVKELKKFFEGLEKQKTKDLEVIIVDQSGDDRYVELIEQYNKIWPIIHVRTGKMKVRAATVFGTEKATGDIITFPDDDCIYTPTVLEQVDQHFRSKEAPQFVTGSVVNLDGNPTKMGRWLTSSTWLNAKNIWTGLIEFNVFVSRAAYEAVGGYDTDMGLGAKFGAAEGPDLGLRLLKRGYKGYFDKNLVVMHPDKPITINGPRAISYGLGHGYAMRKNNSGLDTVGVFLFRPLAGAFLNLISNDKKKAAYYWNTFVGRSKAYFSKEARIASKKS